MTETDDERQLGTELLAHEATLADLDEAADALGRDAAAGIPDDAVAVIEALAFGDAGDRT
jgi:hypothetical protein